MEFRNLVVVLGDQLSAGSGVFAGFDRERDRVWMAEVAAEATLVPAHKARIGLYLSAMRHFRQRLEAAGLPVIYRAVGDHDLQDFEEALGHDLLALRPQRVVVCEPGEWRVRLQLQSAAARAAIPLEIRPDEHFLCSTDAFAAWAAGRDELRIASFYRYMRRSTGILMDGDRPLGGRWRLDGSEPLTACAAAVQAGDAGFSPDAVTWGALARVKRHYPDNPGSLVGFDWPVTAEQAQQTLDAFLERHLPHLRRDQTSAAVAEGGAEARLNAALNLELLSPRDVLDGALAAHDAGHAPLAAVERLVRQVLGWREFLRGLYWYLGPDHGQANALGANRPLPGFYWTGATDMECLRDTITTALERAYTRPLARFSITGLFALLLGVHPDRLQGWNVAMAADAAEWMERPITFGPSQFADAGRWSPAPYVASGRHIQRTTGHCQNCRYRPNEALGERACPFTTLYWDFLARHRQRLRNGRTLDGQELGRLDQRTLAEVRRRAAALKARFAPIRWGLEPG